MTGESTVWSQVLFAGLPLAHAERDEPARVDGDRDPVERVVRLHAGP